MYRMSGKRGKIRRQVTFAYSAVILVYILDQASKFLASRLLSPGESVPVIKNLLHMTLVYNTGAAFGMFSSHPYFFVAVAVLSVFLINYLFIRKGHKLMALEGVALGFILAGTLGNLTDRLRVGYVIDFIDLRVWPVFNLADSFITIGAVMLGWSILWGARGRKTEDRGQKTEGRRCQEDVRCWLLDVSC